MRRSKGEVLHFKLLNFKTKGKGIDSFRLLSYGLHITTTVIPEGWLWHSIPHEG